MNYTNNVFSNIGFIAAIVVGIGLVLYVFITAGLLIPDGKRSLYMAGVQDCFIRVSTEDAKVILFPNDTASAQCHMERRGDTIIVYPIWRNK